MNFLEAHKLVHDYIDVIAMEANPYALMYRPLSSFPSGFDKDNLVDAYKLFYAHMIMFSTRTEQQREQYEILRMFINTFIEDSKYNNIVTCGKILKDSSFMTKKRYSDVLPILDEYYALQMKESSQLMLHSYRGDEIVEYYNQMVKEAKKARETLKKLNEENPDLRRENLFNVVDDYCELAYSLANIPMDYYDTVFFKTFDVLREWANRKAFNGILTPYKEYIETNK